jgi:hypothetical protein
VLRTRDFKSHQEAVDAAKPGDSVVFDSADARPVIVQRPLHDVQFLSGAAAWELHADVVDCQWILHEAKSFTQRAGRLERCAFYRCPLRRAFLTHADAVSFYFDERAPLHPKDNPDAGKTSALWLTGFVRDVLILKPFCGVAGMDKRYDMNWAPAVRIQATDPEGDGRGTYILSPVVQGQRAWTPFQVARGNAVTFAHLTADGGAWADPVLELLRGDDCVVLATAFGPETPAVNDLYEGPPKKLRYHDHEEFGHEGPAFRGAAVLLQGQRCRVVAHGDARRPWTVGRRSGLPGLHYADGVVAADPFLRQFATERGGLSVNFVEPKFVFVMQPTDAGAEFLSSPKQPDGEPKYPRDGPDLHKPTFVPLKDLRLGPGEFDKQTLLDLTGKPGKEIEKALAADKSVYLGPGTYEFAAPVRAGLVVGAGMDRTVLKWPAGVDCAQRSCRGLLNCTVEGGRFGYNSQAGAGARTGNAAALFLRTRFRGQQEAGVNLHTCRDQTWQDCEFDGGRVGFAHGLDKGPGLYKGDKGAAGGLTIDGLNLCNCTFRHIKHRAIDIAPDAPKLGHVGIHNCLFEDIGDTAIRIEGGQTHLVQLCKLGRCGHRTYAPAIRVRAHGTLALSHLDVDCRGVKGNPVCVSLQGVAAVSHGTIRGIATALRSEDQLAADYVTADGNIEAPKDSLLCRCRFKNMDLPTGTAVALGKEFRDVTALAVATVPGKAPPGDVPGHRARVVNKRKLVEWQPAADAGSAVVRYAIFSGEKEVGRTPFRYEPAAEAYAPLLPVTPPLSFTDPDPANRGYDVAAVNAAGLASGGKSVAPRRLGPARAIFRTKDGEEITIKDFINVKGKVTQVLDPAGTRHALNALGLNGLPNEVTFEWGEAVEGP